MADEGEKTQFDDSPGTELAANRTALALERTRMAADRTLMAALRTSLALIGFGFTIFKFFHEAGKQLGNEQAMAISARNFGLSLIVLGVGLLIAAFFNHWQSFHSLHRAHVQLHDRHLSAWGSKYRASPTGVIAVLLLLTGMLVILGIIARTGPFG